jgi:uncharacterized protein (DUF1697 family)
MPRTSTYVALLRGINLGARNKVAMADLRALLAELGAADVATYLQSGNAVFKSAGRRGELAAAVEQGLRRDLGVDVKVLLRTRKELESVVGANPFARRDAKALHVTFLDGKPEATKVKRLDARRSEPDEFRVVGREVYLHCPNGYGRSKLSNAYFEKELGVAATTRNWKTVTALAELASRP